MFLLEDDTGIVGANALVSVDYVDQYHSDRGNSGWTGDQSSKEAAIIKATDYVELRFSERFIGLKRFTNQKKAQATLTLTQNPVVMEELTIGSNTLTFGSDITIVSGSIESTIGNIISAVNGNTPYEAVALEGLRVVLKAGFDGFDGNDISVSTNATGASLNSSTLIGGSDVGRAQSLSWPRRNVYNEGGVEIVTVPDQVKNAVSEYALRALTASLLPDPSTDESGQLVVKKMEKVGPIETETELLAQQSVILKKYPAADRWLTRFLRNSSGVYR